jgi:hypothetical protein
MNSNNSSNVNALTVVQFYEKLLQEIDTLHNEHPLFDIKNRIEVSLVGNQLNKQWIYITIDNQKDDKMVLRNCSNNQNSYFEIFAHDVSPKKGSMFYFNNRGVDLTLSYIFDRINLPVRDFIENSLFNTFEEVNDMKIHVTFDDNFDGSSTTNCQTNYDVSYWKFKSFDVTICGEEPVPVLNPNKKRKRIDNENKQLKNYGTWTFEVMPQNGFLRCTSRTLRNSNYEPQPLRPDTELSKDINDALNMLSNDIGSSVVQRLQCLQRSNTDVVGTFKTPYSKLFNGICSIILLDLRADEIPNFVW